MTKPIQNPKNYFCFSQFYICFSDFFSHWQDVFRGISSVSSSCIIFFPASILLFVQLFLLGKKILYTEEGICIHVPFQRVYTVFLDRNRMSDACRSAGSFKF